MADDIALIMARDPREYTTEGGELETIIARFRQARAQFNLGARAAGGAKAIKKAAATPVDTIDLDQLLGE